MEYGKYARQCRKSRGVSRTELAKRSGVSASTIYNFETDTKDLTLSKAVAIADALDVSLDDLVGRKEESPQDANCGLAVRWT